MRARASLIALVLLAVSACAGDNGSVRSSSPPRSSAGNDLVVLEDDRKLQAVDNVVPVVNAAAWTPALEQTLNAAVADLTTADLVGLNRAAEVERKTPAAVAKAYFEQLDPDLPETGRAKVVVGAANFSENQILAHLLVLALDAAGFDASVRPVTNREVYEPALERGDIQVVAEYVGTLTDFLNKRVNGPAAQAIATGDVTTTLAALRELAAKRGLRVLEPAEAADQNAFAVTKRFAVDNDLRTLSDLRRYDGPLVLGGPPECATRPYCRPGLERTYGLSFDGFVALDAGGPLTKTALKTGKVQLGLVFSSDGSLSTLE